jgi:hypothetical protein
MVAAEGGEEGGLLAADDLNGKVVELAEEKGTPIPMLGGLPEEGIEPLTGSGLKIAVCSVIFRLSSLQHLLGGSVPPIFVGTALVLAAFGFCGWRTFRGLAILFRMDLTDHPKQLHQPDFLTLILPCLPTRRVVTDLPHSRR